MTNQVKRFPTREYIAYELGILAETDMQTEEMKENEIIAMAVKYEIPINELKKYRDELDSEFSQRFLESIPK